MALAEDDEEEVPGLGGKPLPQFRLELRAFDQIAPDLFQLAARMPDRDFMSHGMAAKALHDAAAKFGWVGCERSQLVV